MRDRVEIVQGDITAQQVDAVVNAANSSLLGGAGVDGAIHRAAGPKLLEECRRLGGCPTGEAKITQGWDLPAKYVIHTVGPVWQDSDQGENQLLARCSQSCMELAVRCQIRTIAFPAISTGAYRFPLERATRIALSETTAILKAEAAIERVTFVCFSHRAYEYYRAALQEVTGGYY